MKIVLVDPGWPQTGYLIATLAKAGIEVVRVGRGPFDQIGLGHYCRNIIAPDKLCDPDFITSVLRSEQADLVIPLAEDIQMLMWDFPDDLQKDVFPQTNPLQRKVLTHRPSMYELASSIGVPVPSLMQLDSEESITRVAGQLGFPFVIRGTQGLAGMQVKIVNNLAEALNAYKYLLQHSPGEPFAQPFVVGKRCLFGGLFVNGRMYQWFSQTTLESSQPPTGPTIRLKSLRDPKLTGYAERMFKKLEWTGLACAEFMCDEKGDYYFLEINPRPWAAIQAAHVCGVPLLKSFAYYLLGKEPEEQVDFRTGKEIVLFPQFINHRPQSGNFWHLKNLRYYLKSLADSPWQDPYLLFYYLRTFWWGRS